LVKCSWNALFVNLSVTLTEDDATSVNHQFIMPQLYPAKKSLSTNKY